MNKNKIMILSAVLILCLTVVGASFVSQDDSNAANTDMSGNLTNGIWSIDGNGQLTITGNTSNVTMGETEASGLWSERTDIKSVVMTGFSNLASNAFKGCTEIISIDLGMCNTVNNYAFQDCKNLEKVVGEKVLTLGSYAFNGCSSIETVSNDPSSGVYLPELTTIKSNAFRECSSLRYIELPNVTTAEDNSMYDNQNLEKVVLINVYTLNSNTLNNCPNLKEVIMPSLTTVRNNTFANCGNLTTVDFRSLVNLADLALFSSKNNIKNVTSVDSIITEGTVLLGSNITMLPTSLFNGCKSLTTVNLPDVTVVGNSCFNECTTLETVVLNDTECSLGTSAFNNCISLKTVTATITELMSNSDNSSSTFLNCSRLVSVKPSAGHSESVYLKVDSIPRGSFRGCASIGAVVVDPRTPGADVYIENNGFRESGISELTINGGLKLSDREETYTEGAFATCRSLIKIDLNRELTGKIPSGTFYNCTLLKEILVNGSNTAFDNITSVGTNALYNTASLNLDITMNDVTSIGAGAFQSSGITSLNLGLTSGGAYDVTIMQNAFNSCTSLREVVINGTMTTAGTTGTYVTLGMATFNSCSNLVSFYVKEIRGELGNQFFSGCSRLAEFQKSQNDSDTPTGITAIGYLCFNGCSSLRIELNLESVTIVEVQGFYMSSIEKVAFGSSSTNKGVEISSSSFYGCTRLTEVMVYGEITSLYKSQTNKNNENVFRGCTNLVSIYSNGLNVDSLGTYYFLSCENLVNVCKPNETGVILNNVESVGISAFNSCKSIVSIKAPKLNFADTSAFNNCTNLESINSDGRYDVILNITEVPSNLLSSCPKITSVHFTDKIMSVGNAAFYGCSLLATVTDCDDGCTGVHLSKVETIGTESFRNCGRLSSLNLGTHIYSIGNYAFYNCTSIPSLAFPQTLTTIGDNAFYACSGVTDITIPSSVTSIGTYGFGMSYAGNIYICIPDASVCTFGANFINTTASCTIWSVAKDGSKFHTNMSTGTNVKNLHADYFTLNLIGMDLQYNTIGAIDGASVVLPCTFDGVSDSDLYYYIAVNASSKGLKVGDSGIPVKVYSGRDSNGHIMGYPIYSTNDSRDFDEELVITFEKNPDVTASVTLTYPANTGRFDGNRTSVTNSGTVTVRYGDMLWFPNAVASGYTFDKYTGRDTGTSFGPGSSVRVTFVEGDFVINATPREFKLTLIDGGNTVVTNVLSGTNVYEAAAKVITPTRTGYEFDGWFMTEGLQSSRISEDYLMPLYDLTLYSGYVAKDYVISISSPEMGTMTIYAKGTYSLSIDSLGRLLLTDTVVTNEVRFNPYNLVPGQEYAAYTVGSSNRQGVTESGGGLVSVDNRSDDLDLDIVLKNISYSVNYDYTGGVTAGTVTTQPVIHKDSTGNNIIYTDLVAGVTVSLPTANGYVLAGVKIGGITLDIIDNSVTLVTDYFMLSSTQTMTFEFVKDAYIVKFSYNDDENHVRQMSGPIVDGGYITLSVPTYVKVGYEFTKWTCGGFEYTLEEIRNNPQVQFNSTLLAQIGPVSNMTLQFEAQWSPLSYKVNLNLSGGAYPDNIGPSFVTWVRGDDLQNLVDPIRTGYTFMGWQLSNGADRIIIANGMELTLDIVNKFANAQREMNAVAIWEERTYTVSFDPNGGSGGSNIPSMQVKYGESFVMPSHGTTIKPNHTYGGWITHDGTIVIADGATVRIGGDARGEELAKIGDVNGIIRFDMNWTSTDYHVSYDMNGGHGAGISDPNTYNIGDPFTAADGSGLARDGYYFLGWSPNRDSISGYNFRGDFDTTLAYYAEQDPGKTVVLYAVWGQLQYNIKYDLNGGMSGANTPSSAFYGKTVDIDKPSRIGYDFAGWTAVGLTSDAQYVFGDGFILWSDGTKPANSEQFRNLCSDMDGTVTLKATWIKATYNVQYDLNGGEGDAPQGNSGSVGDPFDFPTTTATKDGYSFGGWSIDGVSPIKGNVFTNAMAAAAGDNGILTLYAVWNPEQYFIEFRYSPDDDYIRVVAYYGIPAILGMPERTGYNFLGWSSNDITGASARYSTDGMAWYSWPDTGNANGSYVMNLASTKDTTVHLTAQWAAKEYRILYNGNGGAGNVPTDGNVYKIGDKLELASTKSLEGTNGNRIIIGWATDPTSTVPLSIDEFSEGLAERANLANIVVLYAIWVEGSYKVTVDLNGGEPSTVPPGWELDDDGNYFRYAEYGSSVKDIMSEWDGTVLKMDGYVFTAWKYSLSTVVTNINVIAEFDEILNWVIYAFVGIIAAIAIIAFVYTRLERW